jgi:enamine deaminase RidA (YjgF/YER057c/UK114 family)
MASLLSVRKKLEELGIVLPKLSGPFGAYVPAQAVGELVYVAGQLPMRDGQLIAVGTAPSHCAVEAAKAGARQCAINALAAVASLGGDVLDRLAGVVRVGAFVASDPGFTQQPAVANGASELLVDIFGEAGKHARLAVGVMALPLDSAVEVEVLFRRET